MRNIKLPILLVAFAVVMMPMSVGAISSTSYQIVPEQGFLAPSADGGANADGMLNSTSYQLQGAIEPYAGNPTSTSYETESGGAFQYYCGDGFIDPGETCDGADLNSATCSTQGFSSGTLTCSSTCTLVTTACNAGGGGGGGGGGGSSATTPDAPTVDDEIEDLEFTYDSSFLLYGGKGTLVDSVTVDGSSTSVTYPSDTTWQKTSSLSYGTNDFDLIAIDGSLSSATATYEIYRRLTGDVNQDDTVDDYDLSKFVGLWGGSSRAGDFNEDSTVDDYDFSMLVARWGVSV